MKYFTRGWANGELTDDEDARAREAYALRLATIADRLPEPMTRLRDGVSLHDAVIESVSWDPGTRELDVSLIAGTSETGYLTVSLLYRGAMLGVQRLAVLRRVSADREACVLYQELDVEEDGTLVHRLLFWPNEEVTVDFRKLVHDVAPRSDRRGTLGAAFTVVEGDADARATGRGGRAHAHPVRIDESALFRVGNQEPVPLAHLERMNPDMTPENREALGTLRPGKATTVTHEGTTVRVTRTR